MRRPGAAHCPDAIQIRVSTGGTMRLVREAVLRRKRAAGHVAIAFVVLAACGVTRAEGASPAPVTSETLVQSTSSWDGVPYERYPSGQPQLTVLRITIAANTTMDWHVHPMPNAAYVLSGELTVERRDGTRVRLVAGQALAETVGAVHRGITGREPVVLVAFYAGTPGLPLSQEATAGGR